MNRIQKTLCALLLAAIVAPTAGAGIIVHPTEPTPPPAVEPTPVPKETEATTSSDPTPTVTLADIVATIVSALF